MTGICSTIHTNVGKLRAALGKLKRHTKGTPLDDILTILGSRLKISAALQRRQVGCTDQLIRAFSNIRVPPGGPVVKRRIFARYTNIRTSNSDGGGLCYGSLLPRHFNHIHRCTLNGASNGTGVHGGLRTLKVSVSRGSVHGIARQVVRLNSGGRVIAARSLPCVVDSILRRSAVTSRHVHVLGCSLSLTRKLGPITALGVRVGNRTCRRSTSNSKRCSTFIHTLQGVCASLNHPFPVLAGCSISVPPNKQASTFIRAVVD